MDVSLILIVVLGAGGALWLFQRRQGYKDRAQAREKASDENQRLLQCEEVVRYFANHHGYIARSVVTREELSQKINAGASAAELSTFITERMEKVEGLGLGFHPNGIPVIWPEEYRDKHLYVVGKSGYGKTNLLRLLILQDMHRGNGVGVLAPELEMLTQELLPFIPDERLPDVIYFNPADLKQPVVLNPLHLGEGEDLDLQVDETFTILRRVVGEGGPRMDEILRHALYALIERPGSTLMDIEPLLDRQDDSLRKEILKTSTNERTTRFFSHIYQQLPKDAHFPITNRIGRIISSKYVRNCLCPPRLVSVGNEETENRLLNIRRVMDEGKILLCNLSDGLLGEAASQLIGQFLVSKFQTATMSRADSAKTSRTPFYLYLDEFQSFVGTAAQSYEKILSRARKYGLSLTLAHQQAGQLPPELLREVFGNVSTLVSFQVSQQDAGRLAREFINQYDYEIETLEPEELLRLGVGEACCRIGRNSFRMQIPLVDFVPIQDRARQVIQHSRIVYGLPAVTPEQLLKPPSSEPPTDFIDDLDPDEVF